MKEIPDYQSIMLPLLQKTSDGKEHKVKDLRDALAKYFELSEEELNYMLPSGTQKCFYNRVGWAKTYLTKACLLEYSGRGILKITELGKKLLNENPQKIDNKILQKYDGFNDFRGRTNSKKEKEENLQIDYTSQTPEELIESAYQVFRGRLRKNCLIK